MNAVREPESILVVSPDATTLQGLTRALARSGLPVASALGWLEGELWLRRVPVAVVVGDFEELGSEELKTVRRLRASFPHAGFIALVSFPTPDMLAAKAAGLLLTVLEKPIPLGQLEEAVNAALRRTALP